MKARSFQPLYKTLIFARTKGRERIQKQIPEQNAAYMVHRKIEHYIGMIQNQKTLMYLLTQQI